MLDYELRVHIGLPKSASTSLQELLGALPRYLGKPFVHPDLKHFFREAVPGQAGFDPSIWSPRIARLLQTLPLPDDRLLVSDEFFSGFDLNNYYEAGRPQARQMLQRMRQMFRSLRVLVIVRSQQALLRSYYAYLLGFGYNVAYQSFIEGLLRGETELSSLLDLSGWLADLALESDELIVLPFEALIRKDELALNQLSEFCLQSIDRLPHSNPSPDAAALWEQYLRNLGQGGSLGDHTDPLELFRSMQRIDALRASGPAALYALDAEAAKLLDERIAAGNQGLAQWPGWDWKGYGY